MGSGVAAGRSSRAPYVASCTCLMQNMQNDYLCVRVCTLSGQRARVTTAKRCQICLRDAPIRVQQQLTSPRTGHSKCVCHEDDAWWDCDGGTHRPDGV